MTPQLQTIIVLLIVAAAAVYLGRELWRTFGAKGKKDCGCGSAKSCGKLEEKLREAGKK